MSERSALPGIRVKLPCQGEQEFQQRYAPGIAANGFPVPTAKLRPVGSRVHLVLELRSGEVVSGDGIVESHATRGARAAMMVRFERLDEDSIVFALRSAAAVAEASPPRLAASPPRPPPVPAPPPVAAPGAAAPMDITADGRWEELFGEEEGSELGQKQGDGGDPLAGVPDVAAPAPRPTSPPPARAAPESALERAAEREAPAREPAAEPEGRLPGPPAYRDETAAPARGKGPFLVAAVGLVAIALAVGGYAAMTSRAGPAPAQAPAADAKLEKVAALLATADRRIAEGRLAGGDDAALTYLDAARALAPGDPRVEERLALLADTFEAFCARALSREDLVEARVHLAAAEKAAPGRPSLVEKRARLDAMTPRTRDRR